MTMLLAGVFGPGMVAPYDVVAPVLFGLVYAARR